MNKYSISDSNKPKEKSVWDKLAERSKIDKDSWYKTRLILEQKRKYRGGQLELFPETLANFGIYMYD